MAPKLPMSPKPPNICKCKDNIGSQTSSKVTNTKVLHTSNSQNTITVSAVLRMDVRNFPPQTAPCLRSHLASEQEPGPSVVLDVHDRPSHVKCTQSFLCSPVTSRDWGSLLPNVQGVTQVSRNTDGVCVGIDNGLTDVDFIAVVESRWHRGCWSGLAVLGFGKME